MKFSLAIVVLATASSVVPSVTAEPSARSAVGALFGKLFPASTNWENVIDAPKTWKSQPACKKAITELKADPQTKKCNAFMSKTPNALAMEKFCLDDTCYEFAQEAHQKLVDAGCEPDVPADIDASQKAKYIEVVRRHTAAKISRSCDLTSKTAWCAVEFAPVVNNLTFNKSENPYLNEITYLACNTRDCSSFLLEKAQYVIGQSNLDETIAIDGICREHERSKASLRSAVVGSVATVADVTPATATASSTATVVSTSTPSTTKAATATSTSTATKTSTSTSTPTKSATSTLTSTKTSTRTSATTKAATSKPTTTKAATSKPTTTITATSTSTTNEAATLSSDATTPTNASELKDVKEEIVSPTEVEVPSPKADSFAVKNSVGAASLALSAAVVAAFSI